MGSADGEKEHCQVRLWATYRQTFQFREAASTWLCVYAFTLPALNANSLYDKQLITKSSVVLLA